jgi:hypothetical protein
MKENSVANRISTPPAKLELPVAVIGADVYGQHFLESTRTLTIHRHGVTYTKNRGWIGWDP